MAKRVNDNDDEMDMLDEIFDLLRIATDLDADEKHKHRIEAATKYYEAVYLMKRYIHRLPHESPAQEQTRQLLIDKASFYTARAKELMDDESSTLPTRQLANNTENFPPRSPIDSIGRRGSETNFLFDDNDDPTLTDAHASPSAKTTISALSMESMTGKQYLGNADVIFVTTHANQANNLLSKALDMDEQYHTSQQKTATSLQKVINAYMMTCQLYLKALQRSEQIQQQASMSCLSEMQQLQNIMKSRLGQTMDRIETLKSQQQTIATYIAASGPNASAPVAHTMSLETSAASVQEPLSLRLTEEEKTVLKNSSMIASGFFLPWSDDDAMDLSATTIQQITSKKRLPLFTDPAGFLPLSEKQQRHFYKFARPSEIVQLRYEKGLTKTPQQVVMVHQVTPYSIRQQFITDCSFVASLCVCAQFERRFQYRLVSSLLYPQGEYKNSKSQSKQPTVLLVNPQGKYLVKLWLNGIARLVIIDDYLPIDNHGNLLCSQTSRTQSSYLELWVCLIEKAYMKLCGGYNFPGSNSGVDLFSLTGWIPERIMFAKDLSNIRDFETSHDRAWDRIFSASSFGDCLITVSTERTPENEQIESTGLVTGHAYAVLSVIETKNGTRLLQLKNPWAHQRWTGRFSSDDRVNWADPSFCEEVGYNPTLASKQDDGVFWICWEDILKYFQNFHLSWNPSLFNYRSSMHGHWPKEQGPKDDTYNVGENPQYLLELSQLAIDRKATLWILVSRHVTKQEQEGGEINDFLTIHIHRNDQKKRRIWYPGSKGNCILTGAYTNNPHVLVRYDIQGQEDTVLSLVLSQYKKSNDLSYTLSCFCTDPFNLGAHVPDLDHTVQLRSEWTTLKSGGPLGTRQCDQNPMFSLWIPKGGATIELRVSCPRTSAVNVIVGPVAKYGDDMRRSTGKPVIDSGKYRYGFLVTDRVKLPAGPYSVLVTNFNAGVTGVFNLAISSSVRIKLEEIAEPP